MLYDIKSGSYIERDLTGSLSGSVAGIVPLMTASLFNHNSQMLITGATDAKIRIFDLRKRECIASWSVAADTELGSQSSVLSLQVCLLAKPPISFIFQLRKGVVMSIIALGLAEDAIPLFGLYTG